MPLFDNEYVRELYTILNDNGKDTSGLTSLIKYINEMELFMMRAESKITEMNMQITNIKNNQDYINKGFLIKNTYLLMQAVHDVKEQLSTMKNNFIDGCKNAIEFIKEKGINALDRLASFFDLKNVMKNMNNDLKKIISIDEKIISKIGSFSNEYHSAGLAVKNMARIAVGKPTTDTKKEMGRFAKTLAAPYVKQKAILSKFVLSTNNAISSIEKLESIASINRLKNKTTPKPSLLSQLNDNQALVDESKQKIPTQIRPLTKEAGI